MTENNKGVELCVTAAHAYSEPYPNKYKFTVTFYSAAYNEFTVQD